MTDKKVGAFMVVALGCFLALFVGIVISTRVANEEAVPSTQSDSVDELTNVMKQVIQTQNKIIGSVARLEFLAKQLSEDETIGEAVKDADKKWVEKVKVVNKQAQTIKAQQAELQKMQAELQKLKAQVTPKATDAPQPDKGGTT